jgi:heptosyltransferase-2
VSEVRRVLVKEVNWLGDLVMTVPALRAVRAAYPHAALAVLVRAELASFFDGFAWLDEVIPHRIGSGWQGVRDQAALTAGLRRRAFDLAIVLPRSFQSALWMALARVPRRVGFSADGRAPLLTKRAKRGGAVLSKHQAHDYLYLLEATLGITGDASQQAIDVAPAHRQAMAEWLAQRRRGAARLVGLAVAAAYGPAKEWPPERFAVLIDRLAESLDAECVLLGTPGERERCAAVAAATRRGALIAAGETGVGQAAALLSLCDGFIGNDSGAMHLAAAVGIPTVGIFGSTRPARTGPRGPRTAVVHHFIECSPCLERTCRFGHYDCLRRVTVDEVYARFAELLGPAPLAPVG